jgi:NitT/TauT family transport system substrate-binding protein
MMKVFTGVAILVLTFGLFSTTSAQDKKLAPLTVAYSATSGTFSPLWVAADQGLFAKYGLDVRLTYIQGNRVLLSALTAGEIQLYQGAAEGLIRLVSGGGDGLLIASQYNFVGHYVLMTDSGITRLEDLRGQKIALDPTSPTYGYMLRVLERVGMRKDDVTFVQFGTAGQAERTMAVLRKQAAATILSPPNTYAAEKQGLKRFSIIRELGIRQLITVTGTTKKFVRERREAAEAFLRGYLEGLAHVQIHRDVTIKIMGKYTRQRDPEVLGKYYEELSQSLPRVPYLEEASVRATVDAMQNQGLPLPKVDAKALYDNSLLKNLEAEGFVDKIKPR